MIELTIPIEPKPQTRPKFGRGGAYEDPKMKAWRRSATYLIKSLFLQEIEQAESQLKKLEKSERSKMRERNQLNKEILKILLKKQETEKRLKEKQENLRELQRMGAIFK